MSHINVPNLIFKMEMVMGIGIGIYNEKWNYHSFFIFMLLDSQESQLLLF